MFKVSIREFASLAADVYNADSAYSRPITEWRLVISEKLAHTFFYSHFFAQTYVLFQHNTPSAAVIAYRGTLPYQLKNLIDDVELGLHLLPNSLKLAQTYHHFAAHYLLENYSLIPKLTGHSLGGALAQLVAIKSQRSPETVVFNSPGIGQCLEHSFIEHVDFSYIHNVNSKDDIIHTVGTSVGTHIDLNMETASCERFKRVESFQSKLTPIQAFMLNPMQSTDVYDAVVCDMEQHSINDLIQEINREPQVANVVF